MKERPFGIYVCVGISVLGMVLSALWMFDKHPRTALMERSENGSERSIFASSSREAGGTNTVSMDDPRWRIWNRLEKEDPQFQWKMPISFYGVVLDQDGKPIADATVNYDWNNVGGSDVGQTKTSLGGEVEIVGIRGKILGVRVSKEGYNTTPTSHQSFEYAAFFQQNFHEPDKSRPVKFFLTKRLVPERLVAHSVYGSIRYDEKFYYEPLSGRVGTTPGTGPGVAIEVQRTNAAIGKPHDWSVRFEAVNGGLLEYARGASMMAPTDGYTDEWKKGWVAGDRNFEGTAEVSFFLRGTEQRYARVSIEIANPNLRDLGPAISVVSYLNESGSRNLEAPKGSLPLTRKIKREDLSGALSPKK